MKDIKTVHILMGLPGSGKSYWARNFKESNKVLDIDNFKKSSRCPTLLAYLSRELANFNEVSSYHQSYHTNLILDGLFLTSDDILPILNTLKDLTSIDNVVIRFWEEDRELCKYNDIGRREKTSGHTISKAVLKKPKAPTLNKAFLQNITLESHIVVGKTAYEAFKETYTLQDTTTSASWSTGGQHGNCWDASMSYSSGDDPVEFTELDDLLIEIDLSMPFLIYKKIKQLVTLKDWHVPEYYGGGCDYNQWEISTKDLYNKLIELDILT